MAITILRTYYNFCQPFNSNGVKQTPTQRIGIADKVCNWKDIIYKRLALDRRATFSDY
jgi:hypothetical protein